MDVRELRKSPESDEWLAAQCRLLTSAGQALASAIGDVNDRMEQAGAGNLGKRQKVTESQFRRAAEAFRTLRAVHMDVQNALFDAEHELRELREREVSPAELLMDGERLIRYYRFLRRRARVLDGMLAYLPLVRAHAEKLLQQLKLLQEGETEIIHLSVPDCGFALVALEQLEEEERYGR
jgi:hypothetical protein